MSRETLSTLLSAVAFMLLIVPVSGFVAKAVYLAFMLGWGLL